MQAVAEHLCGEHISFGGQHSDSRLSGLEEMSRAELRNNRMLVSAGSRCEQKVATKIDFKLYCDTARLAARTVVARNGRRSDKAANDGCNRHSAVSLKSKIKQ